MVINVVRAIMKRVGNIPEEMGNGSRVQRDQILRKNQTEILEIKITPRKMRNGFSRFISRLAGLRKESSSLKIHQ